MTYFIPHFLAAFFFALYFLQRTETKKARARVEDLANTLRERVLQAFELVETCEGLATKLRVTAATANAALQRSLAFEDLAEKRGALVGGLTLQQEVVTRLLQEGAAEQALEVLQEAEKAGT